jgi:hypothetical protein
MNRSLRTLFGLLGLFAYSAGGCGAPNQIRIPEKPAAATETSRCEALRLYEPHQAIPFPYEPIKALEWQWSDRSKDLRAWLSNYACVLGADAVVGVRETVGSDEQGLPLYQIRGTAVRFTRSQPPVIPTDMPPTPNSQPKMDSASPAPPNGADPRADLPTIGSE